jgi:hypothetical protein
VAALKAACQECVRFSWFVRLVRQRLIWLLGHARKERKMNSALTNGTWTPEWKKDLLVEGAAGVMTFLAGRRWPHQPANRAEVIREMDDAANRLAKRGPFLWTRECNASCQFRISRARPVTSSAHSVALTCWCRQLSLQLASL